MEKVRKATVNAIRVLSAEGVQAANSGHPGLPLGAAGMGYALYGEIMRHNPANPLFFNRDRFVLSAGHGSMLIYSLLHIFGYGITKEDLMSFRQAGSLTPGHPEYRHTPGVETTTGPLGQGIANAVGMAAAEKMLAAKFNKPGLNIVDHYTYVLAGDGCMMEGIESEAASLAGTWGLNKLIVFYDSNNISIEGNTDIAFRENVALRHKAQGWNVLRVEDGNDIDSILAAVALAKQQKDKPTLIEVKTVIGYGSAMAGTAEIHGSPLGADNLAKLKADLNWKEKPFETPKAVKDYALEVAARGKALENEWESLCSEYKKQYAQEFGLFQKYLTHKPSEQDFAELYNIFADKPDATRNTGGAVINRIAGQLPNFLGGSADLAPSNKTYIKGAGDFSKETPEGRNLHFGVREHAMAAITNGLYLHGGFYPYCGTFFVFSDYMKNAIRMSALMEIPVTYVLTHDSIGVGEDGPTHQPVEHLAALRSIPGLKVFRPADGKETAAAWISALTGKAPTAIVLTRQNLPQYKETGANALKGGYILKDSVKKTPDVILMASGSETELIYKAQAGLLEQNIDARVVSVPCQELFDAQESAYRESVLPSNVRARVAVECGVSMCWHKYVGLDGAVIGMNGFGMSAPAEKLFELFGFTVDNVVNTASRVFKACKSAETIKK